jgi:hypothetical protein
MLFAQDASIAKKVRKMKARVRWQHSLIRKRNIDQTRLWLDDGHSEDAEFAFMVLGDSGTGRYYRDSPQRRVAEALMANDQDARFTLHTGDVVYLVGAREKYFENFVYPYREWLVGGEQPDAIAHAEMVFKRPFLPTLGNHDYYDLSPILGIFSTVSKPVRKLLKSYIEFDIGRHGSHTGNAYAQAFIDYLKNLRGWRLRAHLKRHYTAYNNTALRYVPGEFTRIPNRYYTFRYGGIDFFALDSNTFNEPLPLPGGKSGLDARQQLLAQQLQLETAKAQLLEQIAELNAAQPGETEQIAELLGEVEELEEEIRDIVKQLKPTKIQNQNDVEQLQWLEEKLIASWQDPQARGRILYFHHPPYVSETTKWKQAQTLAVRRNLRQVLAKVKAAIPSLSPDRPMVDLMINGHAHCMEYIRTAESDLADANIPCLVCGGSGYSLRRQRDEGPDVFEEIDGQSLMVATSHLFLGREKHGFSKRSPYSCLRIEVQDGTPPQFIVRPIVAEKSQHQWIQPEIEPFQL